LRASSSSTRRPNNGMDARSYGMDECSYAASSLLLPHTNSVSLVAGSGVASMTGGAGVVSCATACVAAAGAQVNSIATGRSGSPVMSCVALPKPRSSSSLMAAMRAVSGSATFPGVRPASSASISTPAGPYCLASLVISCTALGLPLGFPDDPLANGRPITRGADRSLLAASLTAYSRATRQSSEICTSRR